MANPQMILQMSINFFKRNNPVEVLFASLAQSANEVVTFSSKMKLLKYKFMIARQQLQRMEDNLSQDSPYNVKGYKIDKIY